MKFRLKVVLFLSFIIITLQSESQVTAPYSVGTWPGYRSCAISYTFDDGCSNQFTKAIPMFDEVGYKLTLFTVTGWGPNWTNLANASKKGHEIANHCATHANLSTSSLDVQKTEIETANNLIDKNVPTQKCVTMATPYCAEGNDKLAANYFIAVRGCQGYIEGKTPTNFMNVSSVICGNVGSVKKVSDFKTQADNASKSKGWLVYLIHGIDNDGGYSPLASDTLKASLKYLHENDTKFWVNTFGNVARYIKERNCATVKETGTTDQTISIVVGDTLSNNELFNYPLTIRRTLPEGWSNASVTQNGVVVPDTIIEEKSVKYIQFDAVPDGGSVVITKVSTSGKAELRGSDKELKIKIDKRMLRFTVPAGCKANPTASIYSLKGARIISFDYIDYVNGEGTVGLKETGLKAGFYLFQLNDGNTVWTKKIQIKAN